MIGKTVATGELFRNGKPAGLSFIVTQEETDSGVHTGGFNVEVWSHSANLVDHASGLTREQVFGWLADRVDW
jgi:hypothetical protein